MLFCETPMLFARTKELKYRGLKEAIPGVRLSKISHIIQTYVEAVNFSFLNKYAGCRIGQDLHVDLQNPHFGPLDHGPRI
jgi:methionyl aminopeptidase